MIAFIRFEMLDHKLADKLIYGNVNKCAFVQNKLRFIKTKCVFTLKCAVEYILTKSCFSSFPTYDKSERDDFENILVKLGKLSKNERIVFSRAENIVAKG